MNIKYYITLLMILVFSSACAPAYYESIFRDKDVISSKDQLLLKVSLETRDWESAYKIANTYPEVQNTFHDITRIQDAVLIYDACSQGNKQALFSCLKSDATIFNNIPKKTHLGKPTGQFVVDFLSQIRTEMAVFRKVVEKRNLELAKIEQQNRALRKRNDEKRRLRKEKSVVELEEMANKKVIKVDARNKVKSEQLDRHLHEINWSKQVGEEGIRDEMAVADMPFNKILLDMIENKDKSYSFGLDISPPNHVVLAHNDPAIQKSLEIILKNIGEVTLKTRIKTRYIFVSYEAGSRNLQYKFKTNEARAYAEKLKINAPNVAEKYIKAVSIKALDRHKNSKQ